MPRCLVFDLDGTLVDSVPDIAACLNRLLVSRGHIELSVAAVAAMVGDGVHVLLQRGFAAHGTAPDAQAAADFAADYAAHVADATVPYPGIAAMLQDAHAAGWRMAVCTNKPVALAHAVLQATGLDGFFDAVGGSDSFPVRKPDPAHMLATLAAAGADPAHAVMLGDHRNDVLAASGAGMPCIFAAWGYSPLSAAAGAAAVAQTAGEVLALADALLPRHSPP